MLEDRFSMGIGLSWRAVWRSWNRFRKDSFVVPAGRRSFMRSQALSGSGASWFSLAFGSEAARVFPVGAFSSSSKSDSGSLGVISSTT